MACANDRRLAAEMMEGALNAPGQPLTECRSVRTMYFFLHTSLAPAAALARARRLLLLVLLRLLVLRHRLLHKLAVAVRRWRK